MKTQTTVNHAARRTMALVVTTYLLISAFTACTVYPAVSGLTEDYFRKTDHLVISPPEAKRFYDFLVDELRLARSWNWETFGEFSSGGAFAGNVNLESTNFRTAGVSPDNLIIGIAFEPLRTSSGLISSLDRSGIAHGEAQPFMAKKGLFSIKLWTTIDIPKLLPGSLVFSCEYTKMLKSTPETLAKQRATLAEKQKTGPGILETAQIAISCPVAAIANWNRLLVPGSDSQSTSVSLQAGPKIVFTPSESSRIDSIRFRVSSLNYARDWLKSKNILGTDVGDCISIDLAATQGVLLEFTE